MRRRLATIDHRAQDRALHRESLVNEIANATVHGIGVGLAITALVLGVVYAAFTESARAIVGTSIYGATLIFCFLVSTLYHSIPRQQTKRVLLAFDHCAIFLLIAGTYTPITLVILHGWKAWLLFGLVWGMALIGVALRLFWLRYIHPVFILIYLAMGWIGVAFGKPLAAGLGWEGLTLILIGGLCFTGGLIFYAWRRLPFNHALWHLAVLAGAIFHFFAVYDHVLPRAG